jgi:serine/threonine protein kinase
MPHDTIRYLPVHSLERNDCEEVHRTYEMKYRMGRGAYGSVHQVCKKGTMDCDYVLKIITFDLELYELSGRSKSSLLETKKNWIKEVNVLQKLNQCQSDLDIIFSPLLYDAWMCTKDTRTYFYIVMEKYDGNLLQFISIHKKQESMAKALVVQTLEKLDAYLMLIHSNANICMNDIKLENILYKQVGQYLYQFVFADFGISFLETNEECKSNDRQKFKATIDQFKVEVEET